jgi:hypothetical protein
MPNEVRNLTYEKMLRYKMRVPFDVLLVDLWYLDERMDEWTKRDRQYALAGGLLRRGFIDNAVDAVEFGDLWMRTIDLYQIETLESVLNLCEDLYEYARNRKIPLPGETASL